MDRRTFIAAGAAVMAGGGASRALAQDAPDGNAAKPILMPKGFSMDRASGPPVFTQDALAHNTVAMAFGQIPDLAQPLAIGYDTADGPKDFADLTGKIRILALWAEWCPPCLREMPELAALQARHGGGDFEILPVLTSSRAHLDFAAARKALDAAGGQGLSLWVEPDGGYQTLVLAVADLPPPMVKDPAVTKGPSIPCAVIVDAKGMVRGHMVGIRSAPRQARDPSAPPVAPADRMWPSIWTTPDADAFIQALKAGALA